MATYVALAARYGIEHLGDTMADFIAYNLAYKKPRNENTNYRIYEIEPIEGVFVKATCKQVLYEMYEMMQQICSKSRDYTNQKTEHKHELPMRNMLLSPLSEAVNKTRFLLLVRHCLIMVTVPFSVSLIMLDDFALPFSSCL